MFRATNIHYDVADRTRAMDYGGIGAMHLICLQLGLVEAIDDKLHVLKVHLPYSESEHVRNIAFNALCGGSCPEDIELPGNEVNISGRGPSLPQPLHGDDHPWLVIEHHGVVRNLGDHELVALKPGQQLRHKLVKGRPQLGVLFEIVRIAIRMDQQVSNVVPVAVRQEFVGTG